MSEMRLSEIERSTAETDCSGGAPFFADGFCEIPDGNADRVKNELCAEIRTLQARLAQFETSITQLVRMGVRYTDFLESHGLVEEYEVWRARKRM
jgi:hypothetical protein